MDNNQTSLDISNRMVSLMFSISRSLRKKSKICAPNDPVVSMAHVETMRFINENENTTMKEVADYLGVAPPTATTIINNLVKMGLITRKENEDDRRLIHLSASEAAKKLISERSLIIKDALDKTLAVLDDEEKKSLIKILEKISLNV